eukprot:TRINITY_DN1888_c0_g1_i3.p1 TRINITY_DN1888_c0_g1~~TRINITY_DN1888_c0_g1_i3.p1  ORF type:complete len:329 (-),score=45.75 TRINITY_DN1888_c0_g1_i3:20-1006(-)
MDEVKLWLKNINLPDYYDVFIFNGFDNIETIKTLSITDMKEIGIKKLGHLKKLEFEINNLDIQNDFFFGSIGCKENRILDNIGNIDINKKERDINDEIAQLINDLETENEILERENELIDEKIKNTSKTIKKLKSTKEYYSVHRNKNKISNFTFDYYKSKSLLRKVAKVENDTDIDLSILKNDKISVANFSNLKPGDSSNYTEDNIKFSAPNDKKNIFNKGTYKLTAGAKSPIKINLYDFSFIKELNIQVNSGWKDKFCYIVYWLSKNNIDVEGPIQLTVESKTTVNITSVIEFDAIYIGGYYSDLVAKSADKVTHQHLELLEVQIKY